MKHCIGVNLLRPDEIVNLLVHALQLIVSYMRNSVPSGLIYRPNKDDLAWLALKVAMIFEEPSSRTIGSQREAAEWWLARLGFPMLPDSSSLIKNESHTRSALTALQQRAAILCFRTKFEGVALHVAQFLERYGAQFPDWYRTAPIINCGDGTKNHPTQELLDLLTYLVYILGLLDSEGTPINHLTAPNVDRLEKILNQMDGEKLRTFVEDALNGKYAENPDVGLVIAIVGDLSHSRVCNSKLDLTAKFPRIKFILVSPSKFQVSKLRRDELGASVSVTEDITEALQADIIYYLRTQMERLEEVMSRAEAESALDRLRFTEWHMRQFQGVIQHPQPLDRFRDLIHPSLLNHPQVIIDLQALLGIPMRTAIYDVCWSNRHDHAPLLAVPKLQEGEYRILAEESIDEHRRKHLAHKQELGDQRSVNDIDRGMVLDWLPPGSGRLLDEMILRSGVYPNDVPTGIVVPNRRSPSRSHELGRDIFKDIIFLEDVFVPLEILGALKLFAPDMRVIVLRDGAYRKLDIPLAKAIPTILNCPNPACVSRTDPECESFIRVTRDRTSGAEALLQCPFCRDTFTEHQMFRTAWDKPVSPLRGYVNNLTA
ncbi:MAG: hypothetical protein A2840_01810 [Candidatus Buchananbacteria bacterium RIFCSPHIGHO2_01_FULL_47_11b]|uniref:Aspartate transcarbamylase n=1 Tax=Candidatus Buchananbacteria bacterium RIFCSPHIGHO2_01_FULL_47_11b TaxID=1797537 RepID=A0A1G1Y2W0_9BACT|nr:MAG: hypothetical protein A2840_01810 [Candidatus Buchananbacteria bacterium RIFCSPHIGHO2_01_FULL_47_11b]